MSHRVFVGQQQLPDITDQLGAFHFVVGIILNQQISGERAWRGVESLADRVDLSPRSVATIDVHVLAHHLAQAPAVHPFTSAMGFAICDAGHRIVTEFGGDARNIWKNCDSHGLIKRLTAFRQIGHHKALVARHLLTMGYGVISAGSEWHAVDILCPSLDRLLSTSASDEQPLHT